MSVISDRLLIVFITRELEMINNEHFEYLPYHDAFYIREALVIRPGQSEQYHDTVTLGCYTPTLTNQHFVIVREEMLSEE